MIVFITKILLTIGLLTALLIKADLNQLYQVIIQFPAKYIFITFFLTISALIINAIKWHLLLTQYSIQKLFILNLISTYYSTLLFGQLFGELIKTYRLGKGKPDAEQIAASVAVDKVTGLLGVVIVGLIGLSATSQLLPSLLVGMFLLLAIVLTLLLIIAPWLVKLLKYILDRITPFRQILLQLENLLNAWIGYLKRPWLLVKSVLFSVFFQLLGIGIIMSLAQGLNIRIAWVDCCWVFAIVSLAVFLPLTIAGIGIREGTFVGTLSLLGVSTEQALALSFSVFALSLAVAIVGGLMELKRIRWS